MNNELKGKKLLILGASVCEVSLVKRAKEMGVYTIVADYYLDRTISPAKNYADEVWDMSWSDLDALEERCRAEGVDGVTAGYSEFRVENAMKLCNRLGLPCYINEEQLEFTRNKMLFKETCNKNGVPTIREYASPEDVTRFPVILKPVDRGGSIGISVANNLEELQKAYAYAMDCSVCKQVIIEDYISDQVGTKFDVYYAIYDGEIQLLTSDDALHSAKNGSERVVQSLWFYPSRREEKFRREVDPKMRNMIRNLGVTNGYMFVSGFVTNEGEFMFFECGFRLCGGHLYSFLPERGMVNNMDIFIHHALLGTTAGVERNENQKPDLKTLIVNYYATEGKVDKILGREEIKAMDDCSFDLINTHIGAECNMEHAILSKLGMFAFSNNSPEALSEDLKKCNSLFSVVSSDNKDMVYDRPDHKVVSGWWDAVKQEG